jgi:uncharacterized coiled-coil protein SlyX
VKLTFNDLVKWLKMIGVEAEEEVEEAEQIDKEAWREGVATKSQEDDMTEDQMKALLAPVSETLATITDSAKLQGEAITALTDLVKAQGETITTLNTSLAATTEKVDNLQKSHDESQATLRKAIEEAAQAVETADAVTSELKKSANGKPITPAIAAQIADANGNGDGQKKSRFAVTAQL